MKSEIRTVVTFESTAFNMTEPRNYFINPCCFGDDVAEWLIRELSKQGMGTDEKPGQEDFGWYLNFEAGGYRPHVCDRTSAKWRNGSWHLDWMA